jgi:hypothetical protein
VAGTPPSIRIAALHTARYVDPLSLEDLPMRAFLLATAVILIGPATGAGA